jgi:hypothetical protein
MSDENKRSEPPAGPAGRLIREGSDKSKPAVSLRPREAVMNARKAEIVRAMRDAAELKQPVELAWVEELAEIVGVDLRRR